MKLSEDRLAQSFEEENLDKVLYDHTRGTWLLYGAPAGLWREDQEERASYMVREHVRAKNAPYEPKWATAKVVGAVERLARARPGIAISRPRLDANPLLLGTPSGVIDLETGEPLPHSPCHYVTKSTLVPPEKGYPELWMAFLQDATRDASGEPDHDFTAYLQRTLGYCLTGDTREEKLFFCYGPGGNGKGVLLNTVKAIMGGYGKQSSMDTFLQSRHAQHSTDIADLHGARLVIASETSEGARWNDQRMKQLSGRDAVSARFLYSDFFEFVPSFKIVMASNHKPRIPSVDDAWRRRLLLLPFDRKPERPDPELKDKLIAEYPRILQWLIEGAEWWLREGLGETKVVTEATADYFRSEDTVGLWLGDRCNVDATAETARKDLFSDYEAWCREMGHGAGTLHRLTRALKNHGYDVNAKKSSRPIKGLRLSTPGELLALGAAD